MEIDELKAVWKEVNNEEEKGFWVSQRNLQDIMKKKSKSIIAGLVRQLKIKVRGAIIIGLACFILGLTNFLQIEKDHSFIEQYIPKEHWIGIILFASVFILTVAWYTRKRYRELTALEYSSNSVKEVLLTTRKNLMNVMKTSVLSDTIGAPVIATWIVTIRIGESGFTILEKLGIIAGVLLLTTPLIYVIATYQQRQKYGDFTSELATSIEELELTDATEP